MTQDNQKSKSTYADVIIIGGGPAGLSAAIYNARSGLKSVVFAGSPPGGQLMLTSQVENYPGYQNILGPDLISSMRKQAVFFGVQILDQNITSVDFSNRLSVSSNDQQYSAKAIIIATGAKALWLGLESEARLRGRGVSACATCDGFFFKNKIVAVVGGGDTAMEEAQTLSQFANQIFIIHRRDVFRASKIMQDKVTKNPKIHQILNTTIEEILGSGKVTGLKLATKPSDSTLLQLSPQELEKKSPQLLQSRNFRVENGQIYWEIPVDGIFVAIGHKPDTEIFKNALILDKDGYVVTTSTAALSHFDNPILSFKIDKHNAKYPSMTSILGVFSAGDCVDKIYKQAGTAAGLGISASMDAKKWIDHSGI